jgi:hypothetical protein
MEHHQPPPFPEPATLALISAGALVAAIAVNRRSKERLSFESIREALQPRKANLVGAQLSKIDMTAHSKAHHGLLAYLGVNVRTPLPYVLAALLLRSLTRTKPLDSPLRASLVPALPFESARFPATERPNTP